MYSFDEVISRKKTMSVKWDFHEHHKQPPDAIPLWIADMDFPVPDEVSDVLLKAMEHKIFGYSDIVGEYFDAVYNWFNDTLNYQIKQEWIIKTPGVVFVMGMAIKAFTNEWDSIIIQKPLYHPIEYTITANKRIPVNSPLIYTGDSYEIDFDDFEKKVQEHDVKMFILCNPHNPVGRVFTEDELTKLGDICKKYNVVVLSDEIHSDLVYEGHKHVVFSKIKDFQDFSIITTSPSKSFNIAGLQIANSFIANDDMRQKMKDEILATGYHQVSAFGLLGCVSVYNHGRTWYKELMKYLAGNAAFIKNFVNENIPNVKVTDLQGTYLMWLNFNGLGLAPEKLDNLMKEAKIWPSNGRIFGEAGEGFFRFNIGTQKSVLEKAMCQLAEAVKGI